MSEFITKFVELLIGDYGNIGQALASVAAIIGTFRLILKPTRELVQVIVKLTKTEKDDIILGQVENSKVVKVIGFLVDYLFSIKLPEKK